MEDMDCQDVVEIVTEYFEGTLSRQDHLRLEQHLQECIGCAGYLAQMNTTRLLLGKVDVYELDSNARMRLIEVFRAWRASA